MHEIGIQRCSFRVAERTGFWDDMQAGRWEPGTIALLDRLVSAGDVVFDIGAWMGPISLFCGAKGATCHAFEPDPVAFAKLRANLSANTLELQERIKINPVAITRDGRPLRLFTRYHFGDSGSSTLSRVKDAGDSHKVVAVTFDDYTRANNVERIDLLKMDIEGGEFALLPAMMPQVAQYRPVIFMALHFPYLVEHAEKERYPSGLQRRAHRLLARLLGRDPVKPFREEAQRRIAPFLEAVRSIPHLYTPELRPIDNPDLQQRMEQLGEVVLSYRPLSPL